MPQPPFVQRPSTRRRIANQIAALTNKLYELGSSIGLSKGNILYVSSVTGENGVDDTAHGKSRALPFATLVYALTQSVAGDTIIVAEGHTEAVIAAGTVTMNKARVTVKGEGYGSSRPTFTWTTATTATWLVTAAGCRVTNCVFDMSLTALVSGFVVSAAGFKFDNNVVLNGTAGGSNVGVINCILTTAAADFMEVSDNYFYGPATTPGGTVDGATACVTIVGGTGIRILRNYMHQWCHATTSGPIVNSGTLTNLYQIHDNVLINSTASAAKVVIMVSTSKGMTSRNLFGIGTGTAPITSAAGHWAGNWSAAAVATNGTLV